MKYHRLFLLLFVILLLTGCTVVNINTNDYKNNVKTILSRKKVYTNRNAIGYQFYLPSGVSVSEVNEHNIKLNSRGKNYYLYSDLISYYYRTNVPYEKNEDAFISEELESDYKYGYLEVNEEKGKYFIEMMFNYSKIECYVEKKYLTEALNDIALIISSIKYNDDIIENMLGEEKNNLSENETYNIFETKKGNNKNFLKYDEEYGKYDGDDVKDLIEKKEINQEKDN